MQETVFSSYFFLLDLAYQFNGKLPRYVFFLYREFLIMASLFCLSYPILSFFKNTINHSVSVYLELQKQYQFNDLGIYFP